MELVDLEGVWSAPTSLTECLFDVGQRVDGASEVRLPSFRFVGRRAAFAYGDV